MNVTSLQRDAHVSGVTSFRPCLRPLDVSPPPPELCSRDSSRNAPRRAFDKHSAPPSISGRLLLSLLLTVAYRSTAITAAYRCSAITVLYRCTAITAAYRCLPLHCYHRCLPLHCYHCCLPLHCYHWLLGLIVPYGNLRIFFHYIISVHDSTGS
jgi:hypothetical protein